MIGSFKTHSFLKCLMILEKFMMMQCKVGNMCVYKKEKDDC